MAKSKSLPDMMKLSDALYGNSEQAKKLQPDNSTRPIHHFAGYVAQVVPYQVTRDQLRRWYDIAREIWQDDAEFNTQITLLALAQIHPDEISRIKSRVESR